METTAQQQAELQAAEMASKVAAQASRPVVHLGVDNLAGTWAIRRSKARIKAQG